MKSKHGDTFNHDPWAAGYDADVQNEADPIRAGYARLLAWIAERAAQAPAGLIVDLGSGTGNLTSMLPKDRKVLAVDLSKEMNALAQKKLTERKVTFVEADILAFVTDEMTPCSCVVSTYALHHLTAEEKKVALSALADNLPSGGYLLVGDLMFENESAKRDTVRTLTERGFDGIAGDVEEEFFWDLSQDLQVLQDRHFKIETLQVSDLSWGFSATKP